jgi:hypothetical protein
MDQQPNGLPPIELPKPQAGPNANPADYRNEAAATEASSTVALEQSPKFGAPSPQPQVSLLPTNPLSQPVTPMQQAPASSVTPQLGSAPVIADDTDLIEKEWVIKAKEIVNKTKDDPYVQNQEMNKFKAGYQKKRFNRDTKVSQE